MASSQLAIINLACLLIGETPLVAMTQQSRTREVGEAAYENAIRSALSRGPWRFADTKVTLSRLAEAPLNERAYAYQIPADCCRVNRVYPDGPYEIYGDQIHSNSTSLAMDYERRRPNPELEAIMPPHFERYAAHELAPFMVAGITGDEARVEKFEQWRARALGEALSIDAQQRPNQLMRHSPFIDVRRTGRTV
jgi:hypothetical protein